MSRWFRHYAGLMRDEKLVRVAIRSKQSVERVVWVWGAILESASEINDGGRFEVDTGEVAYFLRCDEPDIRGILTGLEDIGRVADGVVARWSDRQFESDTSRERQRKYRERKAGSPVPESHGDAGIPESDVTPPSRDAELTPQETETDTQKEDSEANASASTLAYPIDPVERLWTEGLDLLAGMGLPGPRAKPNIGRWMRDSGNDAGRVLDAIRRARDMGSRDPIPLVSRNLNPISKQGPNHGIPRTSDLLRDTAAQLRADAENGLHPGSGGGDARLLSGPH